MCAALLWQVAVTGAAAVVAALIGGAHAALSAMLGGGIVVGANIGYVSVIGLSARGSAVATIRTLFRAEAVKVALVVLGLWLVFSTYRQVVALPLIATLIAAVLLWPVALLYRD